MKKKTSTIHVRVPAKLKRAAEKVAEANGLDLSSCIRMFLTHMDVRGSMPLPSLTINGFTAEEEEEILKRAKGPMVRIDNLDEFFKNL
ncbi:MAG: type II toxin-antitoxin system RelB/DinJ family antitoxin [Candidatus Peregrinibacteria bacterium]|nr:type II toxin-antitoxin system RelB/DinJ family antitoxin [Candidatus Peregrinibacteria bacterium]